MHVGDRAAEQRRALRDLIETALRRSRCVALLGPRQCGKTTLAREIAATHQSAIFDLEDPDDDARLQNAKLVLARQTGLVVLDEIQRRPDLLPILRVLLDRVPLPARFLTLGSASPELMRGASESLAGRVEFIQMSGFTLDEVGTGTLLPLWMRGGFPLSYLAADDAASAAWRRGFIQTFVERDLRMLGFDLVPVMTRRFLSMLAHLHGQRWNGSDIAASLQFARPTVQRYLDLLTGAYVVRQLPPWHENAGKRIVKSAKVYLRDSGLLHELLGVNSLDTLEAHPKLGASWEGFAIEQILAHNDERNAYHWRTHGGAELDLMLVMGGRRLGCEFKYSSSPSSTRSMQIALTDLRLDHLYVVCPITAAFPISERITALPLAEAARDWTARPWGR